jgi:hypothetical protein
MRILPTFLTLAVLLFAPVGPVLSGPDAELASMESEIAELREMVETLSARLDALLERVRALRAGREAPPPGPEGTYRLDRDSMLASLLDQRIEEAAEELEGLSEEERAHRVEELRAEVVKEMGEFSLTVDLLAGGRFEASALFFGESQTAEGTYEIDGEKITLVTTHENGEEQENPEKISGTLKEGVLRLSDDEITFVLRR